MPHNNGRQGEVGVTAGNVRIRVEFHAPPAPLRKYFTTFYLTETEVHDGTMAEDWLHPEWANLRIYSGAPPQARLPEGIRRPLSNFTVSGPSSRTLPFAMGAGRMWGIGLLPLGWARYVGVPASSFANALLDGSGEPAFASFYPLAQTLFGNEPDSAAELDRICGHFLSRTDPEPPDSERISALHAALVNAQIRTVADLGRHLDVQARTLERLCARAFGLSPKLLLRRQRFLRSLSQFITDPTLRWVGAMDSHYHDQAQFVRDFRHFMGMSPKQYARAPKPILGAIMEARARYARGHAVQGLDGPDGPPLA